MKVVLKRKAFDPGYETQPTTGEDVDALDHFINRANSSIAPVQFIVAFKATESGKSFDVVLNEMRTEAKEEETRLPEELTWDDVSNFAHRLVESGHHPKDIIDWIQDGLPSGVRIASTDPIRNLIGIASITHIQKSTKELKVKAALTLDQLKPGDMVQATKFIEGPDVDRPTEWGPVAGPQWAIDEGSKGKVLGDNQGNVIGINFPEAWESNGHNVEVDLEFPEDVSYLEYMEKIGTFDTSEAQVQTASTNKIKIKGGETMNAPTGWLTTKADLYGNPDGNPGPVAAEAFKVGDLIEFKGDTDLFVDHGPHGRRLADARFQGKITEIDNDGIYASVDLVDSGTIFDDAELSDAKKIESYDPNFVEGTFPGTNWDPGMLQPDKMEASTERKASMGPKDWQRLIVQAFGYTDVPGQLHATFLLGECTKSMWKSAITQVKKVAEKEIKSEIAKLSKWGTIQPSLGAQRDVARKVLQAKGIYPYSELIAALIHNPGYMDRGLEGETTWPLSERK